MKVDLEGKMNYHLKMSQNIGEYLNSDRFWNILKYNAGIEAMMQVMEKGIQNPDLQ